MRYAIFSALYEPHLGGVERFSKELATALSRRGGEVRLFTCALSSDAEGDVDAPEGFRITRLPSHTLLGGRLPVMRMTGATHAALRELGAWGPDRVLVNTRFYPLSLTGAAFGAEHGVPTLVLDHGSDYLTLDHAFADVVLKGYEHAVTGRIAAGSPSFAGISAASARWLETFGIETELVVPNAIDAAAFRAEAAGRAFRRELGLGEDDPLVVFAGRLTEAKGAHLVFEAARMLPEVRFAIAGEGPLEARLRERTPENLALLGTLSHGELSALLSEATALALPSASEGFATVLLEAGAWGVPIAATPVGGTDEVLADPSWGELLDRRTALGLAEALDRLLRVDGVDRAVRSRALAEHVATACSWDSTLAALDAAYARGEAELP